MTIPTIENSSVRGWEDFLRDRRNFQEIQYHGGGTRAGWFLTMIWQRSPDLTSGNRRRLYEHMVEATLNLWGELAAVVREDWEYDPIFMMACFAFDKDYRLYEECREAYNRLWLESPRPLSSVHCSIVTNSEGQLPVQPQDVWALFELDGWRLIAARLASQKKFTSTMIRLMDILEADGTKVTISDIALAVDTGFPRDRAIRWLKKLYPLSKLADLQIHQWEGVA